MAPPTLPQERDFCGCRKHNQSWLSFLLVDLRVLFSFRLLGIIKQRAFILDQSNCSSGTTHSFGNPNSVPPCRRGTPGFCGKSGRWGKLYCRQTSSLVLDEGRFDLCSTDWRETRRATFVLHGLVNSGMVISKVQFSSSFTKRYSHS